MMRFTSLLLIAALPASAVLCTEDSECSAEEYCRDDTFDDVCTAKGGAGDSCSTWYTQWNTPADAMCGGTTVCYGSSCIEPVGVGESCFGAPCSTGNFCDDSDESGDDVCAAKIAVGGVCTGETSDYAGCVDTAYCDGVVDDSAPYNCVAKAAIDSSCTVDVQCQEGLSCDADDDGVKTCRDVWAEFVGQAVGGVAVAIGTTMIVIAIVGSLVGCCCCAAVVYFVCIKKS